MKDLIRLGLGLLFHAFIDQTLPLAGHILFSLCVTQLLVHLLTFLPFIMFLVLVKEDYIYLSN